MTSSETKVNSKKAEILVVIPLRLNSTRMKQKILAPIGDYSVSQRAIRTALKLQNSKDSKILVVAAIDSIKTRKHLEEEFGNSLVTVLTSNLLRTGTDRVYATYKTLLRRKLISVKKVKAIINLQGDMPFFDPAAIRKMLVNFKHVRPTDKQMWTLVQDWPRELSPKNISHVKAVVANDKKALYFSRYPIPCSRNYNIKNLLFHIGVYGYTPKALAEFCRTQSPKIEICESLEQLRALWAGIPLYAENVKCRPGFSFHGIDTEADLKWARNFATKAKVR